MFKMFIIGVLDISKIFTTENHIRIRRNKTPPILLEWRFEGYGSGLGIVISLYGGSLGIMLTVPLK